MPLVELSPSAETDPAVAARMKALLQATGKVPVICAARPGYIVPRIQALAMNEAARMVEEGVASAEDIDTAIKYGFGFRFAVLGMLEFIDWGGGDILYYASRYLTQALGNERYAAPEIVERNMREGRIGLTTRKGFLEYENLDRRKLSSRAAQGFRRDAWIPRAHPGTGIAGELVPRACVPYAVQRERAHERLTSYGLRRAKRCAADPGPPQTPSGHVPELRRSRVCSAS